MAAASREAATTRKGAAAPRARAARRLTRRERLVGAGARGAATARLVLASSVAAPLFVLILIAVAVVATIALVTFATARGTDASDATTAADAPLGTRSGTLEAQRLALAAADCETHAAIASEHAAALSLTPEQRLGTLAALAVAIPDATNGGAGAGGALDPGFAHLRSAIEQDVAAAAWLAAGEPARAASATRLGTGEALQADAYAAAVCARTDG